MVIVVRILSETRGQRAGAHSSLRKGKGTGQCADGKRVVFRGQSASAPAYFYLLVHLDGLLPRSHRGSRANAGKKTIVEKKHGSTTSGELR